MVKSIEECYIIKKSLIGTKIYRIEALFPTKALADCVATLSDSLHKLQSLGLAGQGTKADWIVLRVKAHKQFNVLIFRHLWVSVSPEVGNRLSKENLDGPSLFLPFKIYGVSPRNSVV
jgi:hypothetical protein|tara:strand:+ start:1404 stop:1757 length:354 start_codon:yes stop_codon:yes gene_type:complete